MERRTLDVSIAEGRALEFGVFAPGVSLGAAAAVTPGAVS